MHDTERVHLAMPASRAMDEILAAARAAQRLLLILDMIAVIAMLQQQFSMTKPLP